MRERVRVSCVGVGFMLSLPHVLLCRSCRFFFFLLHCFQISYSIFYCIAANSLFSWAAALRFFVRSFLSAARAAADPTCASSLAAASATATSRGQQGHRQEDELRQPEEGRRSA